MFQGLNLLELASHLEQKAVHLHHEGFGKIKMTFASPDTMSLLEILEGSFGCVDLDITSSVSTDIPNQEPIVIEESTEISPENVPIVPFGESSLASAKLVFPLKSISLVISGIPESLLPLCCLKTLSCYKCQHPSCDQEFSHKAVACNHVHCDHLNVALACLSCSAVISQKCISIVHLHGSIIHVSIFRTTSLSIQMTLPFISNSVR